MKSCISTNGVVSISKNMSDPVLKTDTDLLIENEYAGVNFDDVVLSNDVKYSGRLGIEGVGIVIKKGEKSKIKLGTRVAYYHQTLGSFSDYIVLDDSLVVSVPAEVDAKTCAACLRRGAIAIIASNTEPKLASKKKTVLIHSVAGGVGHLIAQISKYKQFNVIGTVGNSSKTRFASKVGVDLVIDRSSKDTILEVKEYTKSNGVDAVFDTIGHEVFEDSIVCLTTVGKYISIGESSERIKNLDSVVFKAKSLSFHRPFLEIHLNNKNASVIMAENVFFCLSSAIIDPQITEYQFDDIVDLLNDMKKGLTTGSIVLRI